MASIYDSSCGGVKVPRASVIAEALPRMEHVVFRSASECGEIGETVQPLVVIRDHC